MWTLNALEATVYRLAWLKGTGVSTTGRPTTMALWLGLTDTRWRTNVVSDINRRPTLRYHNKFPTAILLSTLAVVAAIDYRLVNTWRTHNKDPKFGPAPIDGRHWDTIISLYDNTFVHLACDESCIPKLFLQDKFIFNEMMMRSAVF